MSLAFVIGEALVLKTLPFILYIVIKCRKNKQVLKTVALVAIAAVYNLWQF